MAEDELTFLPCLMISSFLCASSRKNCASKSVSVTGSWSMMVSEPMPARTRFFATSLARALMVMRRMLADRILSEGQ